MTNDDTTNRAGDEKTLVQMNLVFAGVHNRAAGKGILWNTGLTTRRLDHNLDGQGCQRESMEIMSGNNDVTAMLHGPGADCKAAQRGICPLKYRDRAPESGLHDRTLFG